MIGQPRWSLHHIYSNNKKTKKIVKSVAPNVTRRTKSSGKNNRAKFRYASRNPAFYNNWLQSSSSHALLPNYNAKCNSLVRSRPPLVDHSSIRRKGLTKSRVRNISVPWWKPRVRISSGRHSLRPRYSNRSRRGPKWPRLSKLRAGYGAHKHREKLK